MCHHDNLTSDHPPASCGCSFVTCWCSSRWAAPDLQKLKEDGDLWLVNQLFPGRSAAHSLLHSSISLLLLSVRGPAGGPAGRQAQAGAAVSFQQLEAWLGSPDSG